MANADRTTYNGPPLHGPGLIFSKSKLKDTKEISDELYTKWYETVHIPDILATGVPAAWRFQAVNEQYPVPYLAVYKLPDLGLLQSENFKALKQTHDMLPGGGPIHQFADFDTRFYQHVQTTESTRQLKGAAPSIISACLEPAAGGHDDLDAWYREEHNKQMSEQPGWWRTTRYKLVFQIKDKHDNLADNTPTWMVIHEFDDGYLGEDVLPLQPMTDWTKEVMNTAQQIDAAVYRKLSDFGDASAKI